MITLRILYTKEKYMCFLGHLEVMKLFERIFRFNNLPLKYSEGFSPIPKMTFASPLSVGYSSTCEIMEVVLDREIPLEQVKNIRFPDGIRILDAAYVNSKKSLMASLSHAEYLIKIEFDGKIEQLPIDEWIENFLSTPEVNYEKKAKNGKMRTLNIIEFIHALKLIYKGENELIVRATLQSGSIGSLNPETLIRVMHTHFKMQQGISNIRVEKLGLFYNVDGALKPLFHLQD